MKRLIGLLTLIAGSVILLSAACSKKQTKSGNALQKLYNQYQNGQIDECSLNGKKVYSAGLNAYDAGTEIYDEAGVKLGVCYYASRQVDDICKELSNCETIYRCEKHITGQPAVDKYNLAK